MDHLEPLFFLIHNVNGLDRKLWEKKTQLPFSWESLDIQIVHTQQIQQQTRHIRLMMMVDMPSYVTFRTENGSQMFLYLNKDPILFSFSFWNSDFSLEKGKITLCHKSERI